MASRVLLSASLRCASGAWSPSRLAQTRSTHPWIAQKRSAALPVLDHESRYAAELLDVVGDEGQAVGDRRCRDQQVVGPDRRPEPFQVAADAAVAVKATVVERLREPRDTAPIVSFSIPTQGRPRASAAGPHPNPRLRFALATVSLTSGSVPIPNMLAATPISPNTWSKASCVHSLPPAMGLMAMTGRLPALMASRAAPGVGSMKMPGLFTGVM
jgi:hypothetical protein